MGDSPIPEIEVSSTMHSVTIRDTIDGLLANGSDQASFFADRASYLDEHDLGDIPSELIDTAFVHYADTTSLENADALAPVVTRVGPVPFDETDLPDGVTNELGEGEAPDPWTMLQFAESAELPDDEAEVDPADLDETNGPEEQDDFDSDDGPDFGTGESATDDLVDDASAEDLRQSQADEDETGAADGPYTTQIVEQISDAVAQEEVDVSATDDLDNVENFIDRFIDDDGEDDHDPMDLDFDLG